MVIDADGVSLGAMTGGIVRRVTVLGIAALGAGTMNILPRAVPVAQCPAEADIGAVSTRNRGIVGMGGAAPVKRPVGLPPFVDDSGAVKQRINGRAACGIR